MGFSKITFSSFFLIIIFIVPIFAPNKKNRLDDEISRLVKFQPPPSPLDTDSEEEDSASAAPTPIAGRPNIFDEHDLKTPIASPMKKKNAAPKDNERLEFLVGWVSRSRSHFDAKSYGENSDLIISKYLRTMSHNQRYKIVDVKRCIENCVDDYYGFNDMHKEALFKLIYAALMENVLTVVSFLCKKKKPNQALLFNPKTEVVLFEHLEDQFLIPVKQLFTWFFEFLYDYAIQCDLSLRAQELIWFAHCSLIGDGRMGVFEQLRASMILNFAERMKNGRGIDERKGSSADFLDCIEEHMGKYFLSSMSQEIAVHRLVRLCHDREVCDRLIDLCDDNQQEVVNQLKRLSIEEMQVLAVDGASAREYFDRLAYSYKPRYCDEQ